MKRAHALKLSPIGIGSLIVAAIVLFPSNGMAKARAPQNSHYRIVKNPKDPAVRGILRDFESVTRGKSSDTESRMPPMTIRMNAKKKFQTKSRLKFTSQIQQFQYDETSTPKVIERALMKNLRGESRPLTVVVTERKLRKTELTDLGVETLRNLPIPSEDRRKFGLKLASAFEHSKTHRIYDGRHEGRFGFCDFMAIEEIKTREVTLAGSCFTE